MKILVELFSGILGSFDDISTIALKYFIHNNSFIPITAFEVESIPVPILQLRKLSQRVVQDHTPSNVSSKIMSCLHISNVEHCVSHSGPLCSERFGCWQKKRQIKSKLSIKQVWLTFITLKQVLLFLNSMGHLILCLLSFWSFFQFISFSSGWRTSDEITKRKKFAWGRELRYLLG